MTDVQKAGPVIEAKFVRFRDQVRYLSGLEPGCCIEEIERLSTLTDDCQSVHFGYDGYDIYILDTQGKKSFYISEEDGFDGNSNDHDEEVVYVAMKYDFDEDYKTVLI